MKRYSIYLHPTGKIEAVKEGFSWPAFFFVALWALTKKLYLLGCVVLLASWLVGMFDEWGMASSVLTILLGVVFGVKGNAWRESNLQARGFESAGYASADTPDGAIAVHLKRSSKGLPASDEAPLWSRR